MQFKVPRHSTVAAYGALFLALGGTSYAAVTLPRNSVGAAQIRRNAVGTSEIRNGSVGVRDLAPSARPMTKARIADAVTQVITDPATGINISVHGEKGDKGDPGTPGAPGATGATGPTGGSSAVIRTAEALALSNGQTAAEPQCNPGERAVGGGGQLMSNTAGDQGTVIKSYPTADADGNPVGWLTVIFNHSVSDWPVRGYVVCVAA